jgi:hypothetical protein
VFNIINQLIRDRRLRPSPQWQIDGKDTAE